MPKEKVRIVEFDKDHTSTHVERLNSQGWLSLFDF